MNNHPLWLAIVFYTLILTACSSNNDNIKSKQLDTYDETNAKKIEIEILNQVNNYRINKGFSLLEKSEAIKFQSKKHTDYMIDKNIVSHDFFNLRKQYLNKNINAINVAENVAYGYSSAKSVVNAWIRSDGHRKNMEGNFTHFDVSAEKNPKGKWYFTNIFVKK
ncbi:CAP domain-containing protein [Tenacibaculum finnmarkense]|uniref:SCP domain-containing protein n=1 Tax=Tenacibaculum finnmarkense genomovar ulcerans TaxID=2781388 RepID=A0A2I2MBK5_9FLAO|nr:CAP domain-containing protein [Tenacibaculum finnmarkense]ALU74759.1 hypothetical protein AUW17_05505 [Tenacibaculum dicentrarchi]MBE7646479.1 CAP domain-containing protein [Tenacibaculum finnmarkense genomovar ulcerans]MBE7698514.1 CAP domain-containing protein [Tenacibaculum finnmarkense genomovar ulcerans]SOU89928.1 conserved hypothetical protein [Tenacibaculum finnmarkense genomovar ulcerans]